MSDIFSMVNYELSQLQENPSWLAVLHCYAEAVPDEEGWLSRIPEADGIAEEDVAQIHGKLIAFGFLDFRLTDRNEGVLYQLTTLGRQGLIRLQEFVVTQEESETQETEVEQSEESFETVPVAS